MNQILIDIETLGKKPGCAVLSIGAVKFDLAKGEIIDTFYRRLDVLDGVAIGLKICPETLLWWMEQAEAPRRAAFREGKASLTREAVLDLAKFCIMAPSSPFYGNSPSFDLAILEEVYERVNLSPPWKYYEERCLRTELDFYRRIGVDVDRCRDAAMTEAVFRVGEWMKHHALHDAILEAELLLACERARKGQNDAG